MKKILLILPSFEIGGTNTSLKHLLTTNVFDRNYIDVLSISNDGPNKGFISKYATILGEKKEQDDLKYNSLVDKLKESAYYVKKTLDKIGIDISPLFFRMLAKRLSNSYDIVIGYQEGQATRLASYFRCQRWAWVHCELSRICDKKYLRKYGKSYHRMDKVFCVSNCAKDSFLSIFPSLGSKVCVFYNIVNPLIIKELASTKDFIVDCDKDYFKIVSVGRIDSVKRFSFIPEIAKDIISKGYRIKWYIVGGEVDHLEMNKLKEGIENKNLQNVVVLLGPQNNPYPYILNSNLLACLSSSETFNYTIAEARCLGVPAIASDIPSSFEFIDNGYNGIVSSIDEFSNHIISLIEDKDKYSYLKSNTMNQQINVQISLLSEYIQ